MKPSVSCASEVIDSWALPTPSMVILIIVLCGWAMSSSPARAAGATLNTHSLSGQVPVRSWKAMRDERVVKQHYDESCGAASLATILSEFYGLEVDEADIFEHLEQNDALASRMISFADMQQVLADMGFRGQGFAASWQQLKLLRRPVVVYVKHRKCDHFSVLRGIDEDTVWLADPSLGNRTYSRSQFLEMWETREQDEAGLKGKFLAILPAGESNVSQPDTAFFTRHPQRQSLPAVRRLSFELQP